MKRFYLLCGLLAALSCSAQERVNVFKDPFLAVTSAIAGCPVPQGPGLTESELRDVAHVRAQHGGSCYRAGRCRLPDSYLYDSEIIPRVQQYLRLDGRFDDTSVWVLGERRLVTLMGCVQTKEQSDAMERAVMLVDDVMGVINYLMVGAKGTPQYKVEAAAPAQK